SFPALNSLALAAVSSALSAARLAFDLEPEVWFYWHQGETDSAMSQTDYQNALAELIDSQRANVGDMSAPFTIGGLTPERVLSVPGRENIRRAHINMQKI